MPSHLFASSVSSEDKNASSVQGKNTLEAQKWAEMGECCVGGRLGGGGGLGTPGLNATLIILVLFVNKCVCGCYVWVVCVGGVCGGFV